MDNPSKTPLSSLYLPSNRTKEKIGGQKGRWPSARKKRGEIVERVNGFRLPNIEEVENILKKLEIGFELTDWEIWVSREFL